jgi:exopolysaccharide biosynthesis protein
VKTSAMLVDLARRREVIAGVNADFFSLSNGVPTNALVMDGRVITPPSGQPVFAIDSSGVPHITNFRSFGDAAFAVDDPALKSVSLAPFHPLEAVGGRPRLVRDSVIVPEVDTEGQAGFATGRHPRTAVGIADEGRRLLLVVVDGRRPNYSDGMTLRELARLMLALGARDALNLDGGGSTTMVVGNSRTKAFEIVNRPSDPQGERAVGDALAIVRSCGR